MEAGRLRPLGGRRARFAGRLAGHLGLRRLPDLGETELLFPIDPGAQGRGYATEGGRAALAFGFGRLALPEVAAFVLPENAASIAVLERLGMTRRPGLVRAFGLEALRYGTRAGRISTHRGGVRSALRRLLPVGAGAEAFHHEIHEGADLGRKMPASGVDSFEMRSSGYRTHLPIS